MQICLLNNYTSINRKRMPFGHPLSIDGSVGVKAEYRHRGVKFGIAPNSPDDWGRQLAAGGSEENRTPVRKSLDITFSVGSLLFKIPR